MAIKKITNVATFLGATTVVTAVGLAMASTDDRNKPCHPQDLPGTVGQTMPHIDGTVERLTRTEDGSVCYINIGPAAPAP